MKKFKMIMALAAFIVAGLAFNACDKNDFENPGKKPGKLGDTEVTGFMVMPLNDTPLPDCEEACLDEGPYYQTAQSWTAQWSELSGFEGYYRNNKYFTTEAWNDGEYFYIKSTVHGYQYDVENNKGEKTLTGPTYDNYPFNTVIIVLNEVSYTYEMDNPETVDVEETATEYTQAFPLPEGWEACTPMIYTVRLEGDGRPVWLGTAGNGNQEFLTYYLYDFCGCEESFDYEADHNDDYTEVTVTFTYVPAEDVNDANLVFTFAQGVVVGGLDEWSTPGNSVTKQKTMDLVACEEYVWTVILSARCQGKGQENVNAWTDFKVGTGDYAWNEDGDEVEVFNSKKGGLANIKVLCSVSED